MLLRLGAVDGARHGGVARKTAQDRRHMALNCRNMGNFL
jgi:hypothetical protein